MKKLFTCLSVILFYLLTPVTNYAQVNPGFESGLEGWNAAGEVTIRGDTLPHEGKYCLGLKSILAEVFQRAEIRPLSIVQVNAYLKTNTAKTQACVFLRFYDDRDSLVIEYKSRPVSGASYTPARYYTIAPAKSTYITFGVLKETEEGMAYADEIVLKQDIGEKEPPLLPIVDLDQYLAPFWKSDTIWNETVLLMSEDGGSACGRLLFNPSEIINVRSYDLSATYNEGFDYTLHGNLITKIEGSAISSVADTAFSTENLAWYNIQSQWIAVTYLHKGKWAGIRPVFQGQHMPHTMERLKSGLTLRIVACGMSITRGMDASGYRRLPPYTPPYVNLFVHKLAVTYHHEGIKLFNAGLPGGNVAWAADFADEYINALDPDLVIVDFGMNDFWRFTPDQFEAHVRTIIKKCKAHNRNVEFLLIGNMKFDPGYIRPEDEKKSYYESNFSGYPAVLQSLCGEGIIYFNMTGLSDEIYKRKKAKDCLANPLHPNDYLVRWYAQGMAELFILPGIL